MSQRRSFNKNYLQGEFDKLDAVLKESFTFYLIGGGAMSSGTKETTKDIDIILMGQDALDPLKAALETFDSKNLIPWLSLDPTMSCKPALYWKTMLVFDVGMFS